jgi:hypothetical protein
MFENAVKQFIYAHGRLPEPCPQDVRMAFEWWTRHMQKPERPGETRMRGTLENGTPMWQEAYAERITHSFLGFCRLPRREDRFFVVDAVERGIEYRGDDIEISTMIAREHDKMKAVGLAAYRQAGLKKLKALKLGAIQ